MDIAKIDKNFALSGDVAALRLYFTNVLETEAELYGVFYDAACGKFLRLPIFVAAECDAMHGYNEENLRSLAAHCAGGRLRFSTNSRYIAIKALEEMTYMNHMPLTGSAGFSLYEDTEEGQKYRGNLLSAERDGAFDAYLDTGDNRMKFFTLYFPLYSSVSALYLGLERGAALRGGKKYSRAGKIVYYGSSITQGACASRAGNSYEARISRKFDMDYVNLGFSGNARGELPMAKYLAGLRADIFVCDYDYNSETPETLKETHYPLVELFRKQNPLVPVVLLSRPCCNVDADVEERREIIFSTYEKFHGQGDENIYFIDGGKIFDGPQKDDCTADGCHPNDLGFYRMSKSIAEVIRKIFDKRGCGKK